MNLIKSLMGRREFLIAAGVGSPKEANPKKPGDYDLIGFGCPLIGRN